ncbi:MAG: hypothetical protein K8H84_03395 [Sulfuricella denitrificans]|nr:hypothetical protein [Sulfuricella denitrificans]
MQGRNIINREELVLRAITEAHWDEKNNRGSSSLFKGENISLSRLSILDQKSIFLIFFRDLDKPSNSLLGAGKISVGNIEDAGKENPNQPVVITVVEDPIPENIAHAEITQNISRSIAKKIIDKIVFVPV